MVAINFKSEFAEDVEFGVKRQTIRAKARCKPGDKLQLYTGMRTSQCRLLTEGVCKSVTPVKICATEMYLNGKLLIPGDALQDEYEDRNNDFAKKNGFRGFTEMAAWFQRTYGSLPFEGCVICW
jgi:hypothetical protein